MAGEITIYTDGASSGNPGPGGYGVVLISGKHRLEKSEGFRLTTNNRMELMAVIVGLEALKIAGSRVVIYTDSKYVADSVEKGWVFQWEAKAFKKKKNKDLWIRFLKVYRKHSVRFVWVKGHASNQENELCDQLAVKAYQNGGLSEDEGYIPDESDGVFFSDPLS
jgi:ribonuclease HI